VNCMLPLDSSQTTLLPVESLTRKTKKALRWSASQFKKFVGCRARWGAERILGMREEGSVAASRGVETHRQMELWGKLGVRPRDKMACALLPYAPRPGVAECEVIIHYRVHGITWFGRIDFACALDDGHFTPLTGVDDHVVVGDFKTSSDPEQYGLDEETLPEDVAANIYAHEAFLGGAKRVSCLWLYVKSSGAPTVKRVLVEMDREQVAANVRAYSEQAAIGQALYEADTNPNTLDKDVSQCFKFSPCPFYSLCSRPEPEMVGGFKMRKDVTVNDFDTQLDVAVAALEASPVPSEAPPPVRSPKLPPPLPGKKLPPPLPGKAPICPPKVPAPEPLMNVADTPVGTVEKGFINGPGGFSEPAATLEDSARIQGVSPPTDAEDIVDDLNGMDLADLKALATSMGLSPAPRSRAKTVMALIRAERARAGFVAEPSALEVENKSAHSAEPPKGSLAYEEPEPDVEHQEHVMERARAIMNRDRELLAALKDDKAELGLEDSEVIPPVVSESLSEIVSPVDVDNDEERDIYAGMTVEQLSKNLRGIANRLGCRISLTFEPD
jgi:hypothetical protein